jgi:hypothetical protein
MKIDKRTLDRYRVKKKKKEAVNPNKLFIQLDDIQAGQILPRRPKEVNIIPSTPLLAIQTPVPAAQIAVDPFQAVTSALRSIRYQ